MMSTDIITPSLIQSIKDRLNHPLPGKAAQEKMLTRPKIPVNILGFERKGIPAGVLLLLFPDNDNFHFFLTLRTETVDHHKGQISFPGGVQENNETLEHTALRETMEEIGIKPESISMIGELTPLFIPVTGFEIFPFIGWSGNKPVTKTQDKEVEKIIVASISDLIDEQNHKIKKTKIRNIPVSMPYYDLNGETVWGATSMLLSEFKTVIQEVL